LRPLAMAGPQTIISGVGLGVRTTSPPTGSEGTRRDSKGSAAPSLPLMLVPPAPRTSRLANTFSSSPSDGALSEAEDRKERPVRGSHQSYQFTKPFFIARGGGRCLIQHLRVERIHPLSLPPSAPLRPHFVSIGFADGHIHATRQLGASDWVPPFSQFRDPMMCDSQLFSPTVFDIFICSRGWNSALGRRVLVHQRGVFTSVPPAAFFPRRRPLRLPRVDKEGPRPPPQPFVTPVARRIPPDGDAPATPSAPLIHGGQRRPLGIPTP